MRYLLKAFFSLFPLAILLSLVGFLLEGLNGIFVAFICLAIMGALSYQWGDGLILNLQRAKPLSEEQSPEIFQIVSELVSKTNIPMPKLYGVLSAVPYSFSLGRDPQHLSIIVTDGLVSLLKREELASVIGHELGHVIHRETMSASMVTAIATILCYPATRLYAAHHSRHHKQSNLIAWFFSLATVPVAAAMIRLSRAKTSEVDADDQGVKLCGNPLFLASALQRISIDLKKNSMGDINPACGALFTVQPQVKMPFSGFFQKFPIIETRIARLEAMGR